ncbi:RNA-binding protein [Herbidospora daliensis]|uniref:RNA-binding protein n=1 Tax=Herbidospora daliensis TaxID=295585 RepID=UPI000B0989F8|nr:RNA-binding protein [Herbidospora daliensis]
MSVSVAGSESSPAAERGDAATRLHVHQITKYDPADRDEHGHYAGPENVYSDHGPVEAAYLAAVAAFAQEAGVTRLTIREPAVAGFVNFGVEAPIEGHGLAGLFPPDLTGYHDGAQVSVPVALELVRAMLRDNGAWCRLEAEGRFFVHVGYDQYVYVGSALPCADAVTFTHRQGLFAESLNRSPYDPELDEDELARRRPADAAFWTELEALIVDRGAVVLEEGYVRNASRWHRVTTVDELAAVRAKLTPRARLLVWPDLSTDVEGALADLPDDGLSEIIWQSPEGRIDSVTASEAHYPELRVLVADAHAVLIHSLYEAEHHPLTTAVLPDPDGVLRARWTP